MPTLGASNAVFQLAFGVNAVLPILIADFEQVRKQAAESFLSKIKEHRPDFALKEQDRIDFVDFAFRSSRGLRHARMLTYITILVSLLFCGFSLVALCWAAQQPEREISSRLFYWFVGVTLIGGPSFYVARNSYLKWLYRVLVIHGMNNRAEVALFSDCVNTYLQSKKQWEPIEQQMREIMSEAATMEWEVKLALVEMNTKQALFWLRSKAKRALSWLRFQLMKFKSGSRGS